MNVNVYHRGEDFSESAVSLSEQAAVGGKMDEGMERAVEDEEMKGSFYLFITILHL